MKNKLFAKISLVTLTSLAGYQSLAQEASDRELRTETLDYLKESALDNLTSANQVAWCPVSCAVSCAVSCVGSTASIGQPNCI